MYKHSLLTAAIATSISIPGYAAINSDNRTATADNHRLEETTVTASRIEMPLRRIGSSISILNSADIDARGQTTVAELLRSLPAIGVSNNGGLGKNTTLRIRGEEGFRTKVLIDGMDVSDPSATQSQPQIQHLLTTNIERIEVLRGPQGMMYGADAGGIISITTKKPDSAFEGGLSAEYGRYGSEQLAGNIRGLINDLDYALIASDLSTDGFNTRTADSVLQDDDGYDNTTLGLSVGYNITGQWRVEAKVRDAEGDNEFDGCGSYVCDGQFEQRNYKTEVIFDNGDIQHRLSYELSETERINIRDKVDKTLDTEGESDQIQYLGSYALTADNTLVYGIDWKEESINSSGNQRERDQTGLYMEWQGKIQNALFYSAGVRHDDNDDFGEQTSYRLTSAYVISVRNTDEVKFKGSYGTGFRAPSLFELSYNNSPAAFPPASLVDLGKEESSGYDLGVEYHADNGLFVELVYFDQEVENEIFFDLSGFSGYLQGSGTTDSAGVEFSFDLPIVDGFSMYGNYTYNDTEDAEDKQRVRRPRHIANLGFAYRNPDDKLKLNIDVRNAKDATDEIFLVGRVELDDYVTVNANIAYTVLPELDIYLRGENLFDEEYEETTGFNTAGAAVYGGFRYRF